MPRLNSIISYSLLTSAIIAMTIMTAIRPANAQSILRDTEIEQWLEDYSFPIFEAAGLDPNSIEFLIVGDPTLNAFASGRTMGIFTGLITAADTPNQVEGVIAHEAGHMAGGHGARRADAYAKAGRPVILSLVLAAAAVAAGAPEAGLGLLGLGQQIGTTNALAYTRGQEASADQAAVTYLDNIGHSSIGLVEFFGKLRNQQVISARRINPYLQTHPLANARMNALSSRVTTSPFYEWKNDAAEMSRFRLMQAKILGFLQEPKFTLRQYPTTDQSAPGRYARAVAYYRGTDLDRALIEINSLLEEYPDNSYFQELKGQMLFEFGRIADSVEPHRRSVELNPDKPLLRINLGRSLLATYDPEMLNESITILKTALFLEPDNSFAWFELSRAYGAIDDEGNALLATAESKYHAGDKRSASQFANRALKHFKRGSKEWQQSRDILLAVNNQSKRPQRRDNVPENDELPDHDELPEPNETLPEKDPKRTDEIIIIGDTNQGDTNKNDNPANGSNRKN